jgi:hypothetical protein
MRFLPLWLREFLCWLTGGHRYADINLKSGYNPFTGQYLLVNRCVKCGKKFTDTIDIKEIIKRDMEEFMERRRLYVRKDGADNER